MVRASLIYAELSRRKILKDELRHELNEREFDIPVTAENRERLREFGVIGEDVSSGTEVFVKLKYIDPIYLRDYERTKVVRECRVYGA